MNKPWSVVDDEELLLLRELERIIRHDGGVTQPVHLILGKLQSIRGRGRPKQCFRWNE